LGKALLRAAELAAAQEETALLELARPWLARHYRGFEEIDRLLELVETFGRARLESLPPLDSPGHAAALEAIAAEYSDTPTQARASVSLAALRERRGEREAARAIYKQVIQDLPWPENADSLASARTALARFRQEDIRRRLEEIEKKKKNGPAQKK
ncbi:MAG TPA: hypothetical protein VJB14_13065, partial [Planctomycetota bacterium]|nr:hypothetical protein [Planctomycetota bacterium]